VKIGLFLANAGRSSGGPEVCETQLARTLASVAPQHDYHLYCLDARAPLAVSLRQPNVAYHALRPHVRPVAMLTTLPFAVWRGAPDVLHATFMPPPWSPMRYVYTLVCFSMYRHPEFYPPAIRLRVRALVARGARTAAFLLCVSDNVRQLFRERFRIPEDRMAVTYMAASDRFRPLERTEVQGYLARNGIRDPYFLFSGRWERRKNLERIVRAFAEFKRATRLPHKLVLTGSRGWDAEAVLAAIVETRMVDQVVDVGKTPLDELPYLYGGAEALLYPSLWEGFGMPIVEAMACGTPVITSNLSSMPEVAGDAALLVDPYRTDDLTEAMQRIAEDGNARRALGARGLARAREFSWEKTARQTLAAYGTVAAAA
jgi:glycosyltransferase involved in cell wall biosynthesis